jgi:hypothetical protein
MYLVLLAFGAVLTAAGLMLTAAGVSIHDHTLDGSIVTPGVVAIVGGLLLIGLGVGLRALKRIEEALAARSPVAMPQSLTLGEAAAEPMLTVERPAASPAIKPASRPQTIAPSAEERRLDDLLKKTTIAAKLETARVDEETELLLSPKTLSPFLPAGETVAEVDRGRVPRRRDVASRITPRIDLGTRAPVASERPAGPTFDSLWPKASRPARTAPQAVPMQSTAPVVEAEQSSEPVLEPVTADSDESVSVLKSGVVDGMAYTLYSDGSIEAQLPQGTLRFGSITELRNHIEQSA